MQGPLLPYGILRASDIECVALFRHTQLGAAGAGIFQKLRLAGNDGLAADEPDFGFIAADAHREIGRAGAARGHILHGLLDDAVFQGVEGDDGQTAAGV